MTLAERLDADLKDAVRSGDSLRTWTIRLVRAAIRSQETEQRRPLTEHEVAELVRREVRRRREAIADFERGGRDDLVRQHNLELAVLLSYLPPGEVERQILSG